MTTSSLLNPAYKNWLESKTNPYETILLLEKSEVSNVDLSDISDALEEYVRLFKAEIASPAEILTLSRAYPDEEKYSLAVIDKELDQKEPVVVGGPASVEVVDREGHLITVAAMKRAFDRFMENFRTRNAMVLHSDVQVGWALPAYISKTGKIYKSGVTGDHLFFITELRDDTKIAKKVLEQIDTGKMKSYSIAGSATSVEPSKKEDGGVVMQVNDMELAEVTICEQGVNQRAKFELMKSDTDRPTSSCVDGSCLIKSQEHKHSETEILMNSNGEIDTVGSFTNWVQKYQSIYEDNPEDQLTPAQEAAKRALNRQRVDAGKSDKKAVPFKSEAYDRHLANTRARNAEEPKGKEMLEMEKQLEDQLIVDTDTQANRAERKAEDRDKKVKSRGVKFPLRTSTVRRNVGRRGIPRHRQNLQDVENMQKSHEQGCGCDICGAAASWHNHADDTSRPATDRHGRPTLGHTGHGNVIAILISRMHRKARTKEQQIEGTKAMWREATGSPRGHRQLQDRDPATSGRYNNPGRPPEATWGSASRRARPELGYDPKAKPGTVINDPWGGKGAKVPVPEGQARHIDGIQPYEGEQRNRVTSQGIIPTSASVNVMRRQTDAANKKTAATETPRQTEIASRIPQAKQRATRRKEGEATAAGQKADQQTKWAEDKRVQGLRDARAATAATKATSEDKAKAAKIGLEIANVQKATSLHRSGTPSLDRPTASRTGTTSRGVRQEERTGGRTLRRNRKTSPQGGWRQQQADRHKNIDRTTIRGRTPTEETDFAPPALREMKKAVYEYINKSKGNPGPGKKGRAQYKKEQGQREVEAGSTHGDTKERRSYGRWRKNHPQSEDYRGGKSSLPYGSPAKRLADAKWHEHDENMRNDPNYYNPMDVYDADTMPGGGLDRPDPRHNPDSTPLHRKWQANPARYPALNTPPEHYGDKGYARRERAKEAEAKGLGRGPDTRSKTSKSPPGGDTGRHVQSMQKAVYNYLHVQKWVSGSRPDASGADQYKAQKYAEAKKKADADAKATANTASSTPQPYSSGPFWHGRDAEGKKTKSWIGRMVDWADKTYRDRGEAAYGPQYAPTNQYSPEWRQQQKMEQDIQPEQMQKDVKSLAGGTNWKRQKQRIPRAKTKKLHHDWDRSQYAGAGGSQVMGYTQQ